MIIGCLDHWGYQIITIHEVPSKQGSDCASRGGCITEDRKGFLRFWGSQEFWDFRNHPANDLETTEFQDI